MEEAGARAPGAPRPRQPPRRRQQAAVDERAVHGERAARQARNGASVEARDSGRSPSATVHSLEPNQAALVLEVVVEAAFDVDEVEASDVDDFPEEDPLESPEEPFAPPDESLAPVDDLASLRLSVR